MRYLQAPSEPANLSVGLRAALTLPCLTARAIGTCYEANYTHIQPTKGGYFNENREEEHSCLMPNIYQTYQWSPQFNT